MRHALNVVVRATVQAAEAELDQASGRVKELESTEAEDRLARARDLDDALMRETLAREYLRAIHNFSDALVADVLREPHAVREDALARPPQVEAKRAY